MFSKNGNPLQEETYSRFQEALKTLTHRGPDDCGVENAADYAMGFRRLAIQDLSLASHQPMKFEGGRYCLTFNGEIYNFKQLRSGLPHVSWRSSGDTEVLGEWLTQRGLTETLDQLRGMFAFVLWDKSAKVVRAARDHFGIKPLYYSQSNSGTLILGSEWRSVHQVRGDSFELDTQALDDYLRTGSVAGTFTMSRSIHSLPPGHYLEWSQTTGELKILPYVNLADWWSEDQPKFSPEEALEQVRHGFANSVRAHLVSDVPVGAFLSGGLDSSLMVALMREAGQSEIKAFSIGYEGDAGVPDETSAAEETANYYQCDFTKLTLNSKSLFEKFDGYLSSLDQPTGDGLNTYLVSQLASSQVKTALSGLGADEWFAGYNYHRLIYLSKRAPFSWLSKIPLSRWGIGVLHPQLPTGLAEHKAWKAIQYASGFHGQSVASMQRAARTIFQSQERQSVYLSNELKKLAQNVPQAGQDLSQDWLKSLLLKETSTYLPDTLLRDNDFTSMAHSLELRVPCVDREIFELAGRVASADKLNLRQGKAVLRKAFEEILPPWIVEDKVKKTFTLPLMKWLQEPCWKERIYDTFQKSWFCDRGIFEIREVNKLLESLYTNKISDKRAWRLTQKVWLLFILESWVQRHAD